MLQRLLLGAEGQGPRSHQAFFLFRAFFLYMRHFTSYKPRRRLDTHKRWRVADLVTGLQRRDGYRRSYPQKRRQHILLQYTPPTAGIGPCSLLGECSHVNLCQESSGCRCHTCRDASAIAVVTHRNAGNWRVVLSVYLSRLRSGPNR